jgi:hypothetical protein
MKKVFRVTVIEKTGFCLDVEARDWADSIRQVREALDKNGIKRPEESIYEEIEVSASAEIERGDANIVTL